MGGCGRRGQRRKAFLVISPLEGKTLKVLSPRKAVLTCALAAATVLAACSSDSADAEAADGFRTVVDSEGTEVEVPEDPQRVIALNFSATQSVLDLGVTLVGQGAYRPGLLPEGRETELDNVPIVLDDEKPNIEEIASLEPDLILIPNVFDSAVNDQLREIAPSYVYSHGGEKRGDWQNRVSEVADAINRTEEAEQLDADFQARQSEIAESYAEVLEEYSFGIVGSYNPQEFYAMGSTSMVGEILTPIGVRWSENEDAAVADAPGAENTFSFEELGSVFGDADVLLYSTNLLGETDELIDALLANSLFESLPAAENDRLFPWGKMTVAGYTDAFYSLDQFEAALQDLQNR